MIVASGCGSLFQNRKASLVSFVVLAALSIMSVYDSVLIINSYVNDNRVTLVRTVDIGPNDTLPYLENLHFSLNPDYSLIFPELPANKLLFDEMHYKTLKEEVLNGSFLLANVNMSNIEDRRRMLSIFTVVHGRDQLALYYAAGDSTYCFNDADYEKLRWLTNVTRDLSLLIELEQELSSFIMPNLIYSNTPNFDKYFFVDTPASDKVTAELATFQFLKGNQASVWFWFGSKDKNETATNNSSAIDMFISTKSTTFQRISLSTTNYCLINLHVDNVGVFDRSATTQCGNESDIVIIGDGRYRRAFIESYMTQCGCIPFSFKRQYYAIMGSSAQQNNTPICDIEAYSGCLKKSIVFDEKSILPLCVQPKNQYHISMRYLDKPEYDCFEDNDSRSICTLSSLYLESNADFYAVYTERYQLTPTQFVGQLGGDIGLYTGLSVLSIWQLLVYLHNKYSKFKSVYKHQPNENRSSASIRLTFYKTFVVSLFRSIEAAMVKVGQDEHHRRGNEEPCKQPVEWTEMKKKLDCLEYAMQRDVEKTIRKLQCLESIAMKTHQALREIRKGNKIGTTDENKDCAKGADTAPPHNSACEGSHRISIVSSLTKTFDGKAAKLVARAKAPQSRNQFGEDDDDVGKDR